MTTQDVNFGIVGAGEQTEESLAPAALELARTRPGVNVVAVADTNLRRARTVAALGIPMVFASQEEMLASGRVNAVVIATPHRLHVSEGLKALGAGCHVFVEKPMGRTANEARGLLAEARARDRILMVDYQYARQLHEVLASLRSGLVGEVTAVQGAFEFTDGLPDRKGFWDTIESGGVRLDYLGHVMLLVLAAMGEGRIPLAVKAHGWGHDGRKVKGPGFKTVSRVKTTVGFSHNGRADLVVDWLAYRRRLGLVVTGHGGMAEIPMMAAELHARSFVPTVYRRRPDRSIETESLLSCVPIPTEESFVHQLAAFVDAIRNGKPLAFPFNPELALRVQEVLDAVGRSIELDGSEVPVRRS